MIRRGSHDAVEGGVAKGAARNNNVVFRQELRGEYLILFPMLQQISDRGRRERETERGLRERKYRVGAADGTGGGEGRRGGGGGRGEGAVVVNPYVHLSCPRDTEHVEESRLLRAASAHIAQNDDTRLLQRRRIQGICDERWGNRVDATRGSARVKNNHAERQDVRAFSIIFALPTRSPTQYIHTHIYISITEGVRTFESVQWKVLQDTATSSLSEEKAASRQSHPLKIDQYRRDYMERREREGEKKLRSTGERSGNSGRNVGGSAGQRRAPQVHDAVRSGGGDEVRGGARKGEEAGGALVARVLAGARQRAAGGRSGRARATLRNAGRRCS
jgi:hypothetical protein